MSVRTRIVLLAAAAVLLPLGALYWWTATEAEETARERQRHELERHARLVAAAVEDRDFTDSLADRLGEMGGVRVTLIGPEGTVRGDSRVPTTRVPDVEHHAGRPEVRAALEGRVGSATRTSETIALPLLYVAVPHELGVIRVAIPLDEVDVVTDRMRRALAAAGALGLLLVILASGLLERFATAPFRRLRGDLEAVTAGDRAHRHRGRAGEAAALAQTLDRVDDRLEAAREAQVEAEELARLLDRLDDGVAVVDADRSVRRANETFREWTGQPEIAGRRFDTLFRNPDVSRALDEALDGRAASRETRLGDRTVLVSVRPHSGGAVAVLRDLTRLRRLEGVRRDFVANASHELKTPLTSVLGYAEALVDPELPPEQAAAFGERILSNGIRMRRLIDDLLDLSRIEAGAWEPEIETADVARTARDVWTEIAGRAAGSDVSLALDVDTAPRVRADPEALRQILRNLLDNAARYAPRGTEVRVESRPTGGGRVELRVRDSGPGIPAAHRDRVFERFYRVDTGRSREAGGTGLGLSIVKHLVAAHGGKVGIDTRVGEGTTVRLTLPAPDRPS